MKTVAYRNGLFNNYVTKKRSKDKIQAGMMYPEIFTLLTCLRQLHNEKNLYPILENNFMAYKFLHNSYQQIHSEAIADSYYAGLKSLDRINQKTFFLLEHLNIRLCVYRFVWLTKGNKISNYSSYSYKKTKGLKKTHNKGFVALTYSSNIPDRSLPCVNVLFINHQTDKDKNSKHPIIYIIKNEKLQAFYKKFNPVSGSLHNQFLCSVKSKIPSEIFTQRTGIKIVEKFLNVESFLKAESTITPLNFNVVFLKCKSFTFNKPRKTDVENYSFCCFLKGSNIDKERYKIILLQQCPKKVKLFAPPKIVSANFKTFLKPSYQKFEKVKKESIKNPKEDKSWTYCFCEKNSPDIYINQNPLKFHPKSLSPRLEAFNFNNEEVKALFYLASYFTFATFDIEAITRDTPAALANKNKEIGFFHSLGEETNVTLQKQEIILIGTTTTITEKVNDWLSGDFLNMTILESEQQNKNSTTKIFHLSQNNLSNRKTEPNFENQTQMVANFIRYIFSQAKIATRVKLKILQNLSSKISNLNCTHKRMNAVMLEFHNKRTPAGYSEIDRLQTAFDSFISEYVIFGFNSGRYDIPIIIPYLKYLINSNKNDLFYYKNIKIYRKGTKINSLQIKHDGCVLHFRDFLSLDSPTSLRSTAERYGIDVHKGHFPHRFSTSVKILKTTNKIPRDMKYWKNLQGEIPSENIVLEAEFSYDRSKCTNLYNYMVHYLTLDCVVLFKCFLAFFNLLKEIEGINIFTSKRYTTSSLMFNFTYIDRLSNDPFQMPAFEINHQSQKFISTVLRESLIGGITQTAFVGRAGKQTDGTCTKINEHITVNDVKHVRKHNYPGLFKLKKDLSPLSDPDKQLIEKPLDGNFVKCLDVSSLYASSMLKGN